MDITWRNFSGEGEGRNGGTGTGKKKYKIRHKLDGRDKNGIGNRERKERICTRHGHELSGGGMLEGKGCGTREDKGGKIGKTVKHNQ